MNRLIPRSITLWSGLLTIAFIGWAWWTSTGYESWCRWECISGGNTHGGVEINSAYSGSGFTTWVNGTRAALPAPALPAPVILRGTSPSTVPVSDRVPVSYRDSLDLMMTRRDPQAWLIFIPHWLTLLAVIFPWTALLFWRSRRRKMAL